MVLPAVALRGACCGSAAAATSPAPASLATAQWVGVPEVGILTARTFLDESYPELQPGLSLSAEGVYTLDLVSITKLN